MLLARNTNIVYNTARCVCNLSTPYAALTCTALYGMTPLVLTVTSVKRCFKRYTYSRKFDLMCNLLGYIMLICRVLVQCFTVCLLY